MGTEGGLLKGNQPTSSPHHVLICQKLLRSEGSCKCGCAPEHVEHTNEAIKVTAGVVRVGAESKPLTGGVIIEML